MCWRAIKTEGRWQQHGQESSGLVEYDWCTQSCFTIPTTQYLCKNVTCINGIVALSYLRSRCLISVVAVKTLSLCTSLYQATSNTIQTCVDSGFPTDVLTVLLTSSKIGLSRRDPDISSCLDIFPFHHHRPPITCAKLIEVDRLGSVLVSASFQIFALTARGCPKRGGKLTGRGNCPGGICLRGNVQW